MVAQPASLGLLIDVCLGFVTAWFPNEHDAAVELEKNTVSCIQASKFCPDPCSRFREDYAWILTISAN